nr:histidine kinase [Kibdelosporangium sp. MJ126-NF4]CEL21828.1 two-component system sensor kinase [Kibdelosporangium sp. MJ126-NF4]CTQ92607.1 two-component system sensor kinase [Kibdelosporangium sp. MJ126-NF4]
MPPRPWIADTVWAAALAVLSVAFAYPSLADCLLAVALCAALGIRRTYPAVALAFGTVAAVTQALVLTDVNLSILAVPTMVYSLRRWSGRTLGLFGLGVGLAGAVIAPVVWLRSTNARDIGVTALCYALVIIVVYGFGLRVREREEAALALARAEAAEERGEIAREVHDVVAHSLSLIAVQAEGGRSAAMRDPARAPEILDVIAEESRRALNEIRDMVTVLRKGGLSSDQRGTAGVRELVERLGDRAQLTVTGDTGPALGFTIYRVVQEALTNFLRHAGPHATVTVSVAVNNAHAEVTIQDNGHGAVATTDGKGHGLATMRERVQARGGTLSVGPVATGGYRVHATVPVTS